MPRQRIRPKTASWTLARLALALLPLGAAAPAGAVEYGLSLYQLGLVTPSPGVTPPPGLYFYDVFAYYRGSGELHEHARVPDPTRVTYKITGDLAIFALYTDFELFGGTLGFATTNAVGAQQTSVATPYVDAQGVPSVLRASREINGFADSELTALLGWRAGDNHFKLYVSGFIPTGNYDPARIAQTGLNRPALDVKGAYTFIGSDTGFEASAALGMTLNATNVKTDYTSGAELHFEWTLGQHLPQGLFLGVGGYFYQQVTPDSGPGAIYGGFEGRVAAAGPVVSYRLRLDGQEAYFSAKWYHEFANYNRVAGDVLFATMGFPLWSPPPAVTASR
ncbi:transporter [Methylocella sp.]|uniref:SphA family protein n=1 Tax=Methylocella sp. TaxID=1978226 RepID=UPI0035ADBD13